MVLVTSFSIISPSIRGISTGIDDFSFSVSSSSTQDIFWPSNSSEWTEVAPETQGLNSSKITEMFEFIENNSFDISSIIIVRNGYLVTEEYFYNSQIYRWIDGSKTYFGGYTIRDQYSATKSLISILIGIALHEGFLDNISQTLYEFFAHIWDPGFINSTLKKNITIEQLLTMNAGIDPGGPYYPPDAENKARADCIAFTLDEVPLVFTPGEEGEFGYTNDGVNLLSGIIANVTGTSTEEFAQEYLFEPLGISKDEYNWLHDLKNMTYGASGFECSPKIQAKLGMLCLNNGTWDGVEIIDSNYIEKATTHQLLAKNSSWLQYGYLFYIIDSPFEGYYAAGFGGQSIYVIPEFDIVVGFTGTFLGEDPEGDYETLILDYILQFVEPDIPEDPIIPGFNLNMIFLMIICAIMVILIRSKKNSKN
jgi:hypothetical protein